jgi:hypothetical protein
MRRWPQLNPGGSTIQLEHFINHHYMDNDYIKGRFFGEVQRYARCERKDSLLYSILQIILIVVSALTTFIVGLEAIIVASIPLKITALLLTIFVAIVGTYLTTFNVQAKWGAYRSVRELLITEFYKFHIGIAPYSLAGDCKTFATNVEQLIENANKSWEGLHSAGIPQG